MGEPIVLEDFKERVILVGVSEQDGDDAEDSLAELAELVKTAGASVAGTLIQKRELIHPGTYVGTGKVAEIAELLEHTGATGIVCDDELSPAQLKNLETMLNTKVMDRTLIILDIFAARAQPVREKFRLSWRSLSTDRRDLPDLELPCQGLAVVSVREVREKRSWRWTDVLLKIGSHF